MELTRKYYFLGLIFCGVFYVTADQNQNCRMEDFEVQSNFNETRFEGKWYELSWIILPWIKVEWNYLDYTHTYTQTDYGFSYIGSGRDPYNKTVCLVERPLNVFRTGDNAKYIKEYKLPDDAGYVNASYWIMETDYINYALVVGCREVASNGTCVEPDGWLWSRCPNPPTEHTKRMEDKLSQYCLKKDMFSTTLQEHECGKEIGTCGGSGIRAISWLTVTAVIVTLSLVIEF